MSARASEFASVPASRALANQVLLPPTARLSIFAELIPANALGPGPPPDLLVEFNSVILAGLVEEAGGVPDVWPIVPDDPAALTDLHLGPFDLALSLFSLTVDANGNFDSTIDGTITIPGLETETGDPAEIDVSIDVNSRMRAASSDDSACNTC